MSLAFNDSALTSVVMGLNPWAGDKHIRKCCPGENVILQGGHRLQATVAVKYMEVHVYS